MSEEELFIGRVTEVREKGKYGFVENLWPWEVEKLLKEKEEREKRENKREEQSGNQAGGEEERPQDGQEEQKEEVKNEPEVQKKKETEEKKDGSNEKQKQKQEEEERPLYMYHGKNIVNGESLFPSDYCRYSLFLNENGHFQVKKITLFERGPRQRKVYARGGLRVVEGDGYPCRFCGQKFSNQPILGLHIESQHPGAEEYLKQKANQESNPASTAPPVSTEAIKNLVNNLTELDDSQTLLTWLQGIKLEDYLQGFLDAGFGTLKVITEADEAQTKTLLDNLKLPLGHRKRFQRAVAALKEAQTEKSAQSEQAVNQN